MYKLWAELPSRWIAAGFLAGACLTFALGEPPKPPAPRDRFVVKLRGEKTVNIEKPQLTLSEIAFELSKQTGRKFTLDKKFEADKTPYAILLNKTPLSHVLDATAYLAAAKWERTGLRYNLRPLTSKEMVGDANLIGTTIDRLADYLSSIPADDPSLPKGAQNGLRDFRESMASALTTFPPFPEDTMNLWKISASEKGLGISYQMEESTGDTTTGQWHSRSWGWENAETTHIGR